MEYILSQTILKQAIKNYLMKKIHNLWSEPSTSNHLIAIREIREITHPVEYKYTVSYVIIDGKTGEEYNMSIDICDDAFKAIITSNLIVEVDVVSKPMNELVIKANIKLKKGEIKEEKEHVLSQSILKQALENFLIKKIYKHWTKQFPDAYKVTFREITQPMDYKYGISYTLLDRSTGEEYKMSIDIYNPAFKDAIESNLIVDVDVVSKPMNELVIKANIKCV